MIPDRMCNNRAASLHKFKSTSEQIADNPRNRIIPATVKTPLNRAA